MREELPVHFVNEDFSAQFQKPVDDGICAAFIADVSNNGVVTLITNICRKRHWQVKCR